MVILMIRKKYNPWDLYQRDDDDFPGLHLIFDQHFNSQETTEWNLHQDLVAALELKKEGDVWVSPNEGYVKVARITKEANGKPSLLVMHAEHLKDYLCARNMGLYIASYFSRETVVEDASFITWQNGSSTIKNNLQTWEGHIREIHEGGFPYGEKAAVFHVARTDAEVTDDIPDISGKPSDKNIKSQSWEKSFSGRKLFEIGGYLWRYDWIDPAELSPRVRGDKPAPTIFFIVDEQGKKENKDVLSGGGKWLWFKPDVIMALAHRRGGNIKWYTRDTGSISCSPDYDVLFGVNSLGLVNVYAKDVALLPDWQQQIWVGYNIGPEGGISEELFASQVSAEPANSQPPEPYLKRGIEKINTLAMQKLNISLFRKHELLPEIFEKTHRFRALDDAGLFSLAKDVTRLTADSLDIKAMQGIISPPPGKNWGSLKTLENLLASKIEAQIARDILGPLVGIYNLRLADAHLPGSDIDDNFTLIGIDRSLPNIIQGYQLLDASVSSLYAIADVMNKWNEPEKRK